jgi:hypothetical protein
MIENGDLFNNKPKIMYNRITGEWVVTKCNPDIQFACAGTGREKACSYIGNQSTATSRGRQTLDETGSKGFGEPG